MFIMTFCSLPFICVLSLQMYPSEHLKAFNHFFLTFHDNVKNNAQIIITHLPKQFSKIMIKDLFVFKQRAQGLNLTLQSKLI